MEQGFIDALRRELKTRDKDILLDARGKGLVQDVAGMDFQREAKLLRRVLETEIPKMLRESDEAHLAEAKRHCARRLRDEEGMDLGVACGMVDLLGLLFHEDTGKTRVEAGTPETPGTAPPALTPARPASAAGPVFAKPPGDPIQEKPAWKQARPERRALPLLPLPPPGPRAPPDKPSPTRRASRMS